MAWSDPGDFTSGQILTAAQMDSVREAMFFGQATFTNEAARDSAFGAPLSPIALQEGMRAYLQTSTVAAATGAITAVPTGITTTYNGSNWPCITPIHAGSRTTASTTSTSYVSTLTGDSTAVSVTCVTGTTAMLTLSALFQPSGTLSAFLAVSVSGATTISAAASTVTAAATQATATYWTNMGVTQVLTGLTAGTNTFTLNYATSAGTTTFYQRFLTVQGIA